MSGLIALLWRALFLNPAPYAEIGERPRPALRGLALVVLVGLAVALAGLVGTVLNWATTPDMADMQQVVREGLEEMPWFGILQQDPEGMQTFEQYWDLGWQVGPQLFGAPSIPGAAARIVLLPLGLAVVWLLYGLLAHLFARLFGGQSTLGQTLGATALAVAPQILNLATFFPYVAVGAVVGLWTLLSRYTAVKTAHGLTWGRALWATLLPYVLFAIVVALVAGVATAVAAALFAGR